MCLNSRTATRAPTGRAAPSTTRRTRPALPARLKRKRSMSLRKLPEAATFQRPQNFQWDAPSDVLAKWAEHPLAAASDDPGTITIFDVIGEDMWSGGGFTAKRMAGALRAIGKKPVTVQVNSPGGDMFEGIAIYNLLRAHPEKVTIEVLGWAASAAS